MANSSSSNTLSPLDSLNTSYLSQELRYVYVLTYELCCSAEGAECHVAVVVAAALHLLYLGVHKPVGVQLGCSHICSTKKIKDSEWIKQAGRCSTGELSNQLMTRKTIYHILQLLVHTPINKKPLALRNNRNLKVCLYYILVFHS